MDEPREQGAARAGEVVVLNRDLMFGSRIAAALKALGLRGRFVRDLPGLTAALGESGIEPLLVVVDMNATVDWDALAALIDARGPVVPFLGFGPHVDIAGRRAAKAAGMTRIVSNGAFHKDTAGLIARYARGEAT